MRKYDLPAWSRYFGSLAAGAGIVALSAMFLIEAPTASIAKFQPESPTVATLKRAVDPKPLPQLKASDFDISKSVKVDVVARAETQTLPAPKATGSREADPPKAPTAKPVAVVTGDAVNLRASARKTSDRVDVVRAGTRVSVLETVRGWSRITTENGTTGWLASKFLSR
jgi:uncharacterized protein YgiM (DUF1202 family)